MLRENATVTICHSRTKNLKEICKEADILIVAIGKPKMIDASYVKAEDDRRIVCDGTGGRCHHTSSGRRRTDDDRDADE